MLSLRNTTNACRSLLVSILVITELKRVRLNNTIPLIVNVWASGQRFCLPVKKVSQIIKPSLLALRRQGFFAGNVPNDENRGGKAVFAGFNLRSGRGTFGCLNRQQQ